MTTKHTPGPWTCSAQYSRRMYTIFDADGNYHRMPDEAGEMDANAALIAAAPDLLAALEELLWAASRTSLETDGDYSNAFTAARVAIAKATGAAQ